MVLTRMEMVVVRVKVPGRAAEGKYSYEGRPTEQRNLNQCAERAFWGSLHFGPLGHQPSSHVGRPSSGWRLIRGTVLYVKSVGGNRP